MKRKLVPLLISLLLFLPVLSIVVFAHPGGTDANGGHTDQSSGYYHYHHGYSAHEHYDMNGDSIVDCPYDFEDATSSKPASTSKGFISSQYFESEEWQKKKDAMLDARSEGMDEYRKMMDAKSGNEASVMQDEEGGQYMLSGIEPEHIILFLYMLTAILNYYRLCLEDDNKKPGLQKIIFIITLITGFLSLPITFISMCVFMLYTNRLTKQHERESLSAKVEVIDSQKTIESKDAEIRGLKKRLAQYDAIIESDRNRCRTEGYNAGTSDTRKVFEKRMEQVRCDGYTQGYKDAQQDFPLGIDRLAEFETFDS